MVQMHVQTSGRVTTPKTFVSPPALLLIPLRVFWLLICVLERISTLQLPPRFTTTQGKFVRAIFEWNFNPLLAPCDAPPHLFTFFHSHHRGLARGARLEASTVPPHATAPSSNGPTTASCQRTADLFLSNGCGVCKDSEEERNGTRPCRRDPRCRALGITNAPQRGLTTAALRTGRFRGQPPPATLPGHPHSPRSGTNFTRSSVRGRSGCGAAPGAAFGGRGLFGSRSAPPLPPTGAPGRRGMPGRGAGRGPAAERSSRGRVFRGKERRAGHRRRHHGGVRRGEHGAGSRGAGGRAERP